MKILLTHDAFINRDMIKREFEITDNYYLADLIISGSFPGDTVPQLSLPNSPFYKKLIYMTSEPAICEPRTTLYNNFDKMFLVACYNPTKPNQIPLTIDNKHGTEFPFPIVPFSVEPITRGDTTLKNRGIFLAGELSLDSDEKPHGFINIKKLRRDFTKVLEEKPQNYIIGTGTKRGRTTPTDGHNVRVDKQEQIMTSNCDFVMAMENSVYPDYVTEKLGEAFTSDRVALYLGAPNIENHCPTNCFVDMRKWFNPADKSFDFKGFQDYIDNMTQEEYNAILANARAFRTCSKEKYEVNQVDLTQRVIDYIKSHYGK